MAILAIVLLKALVGYLQESRAESALAALRVMTAPHACVLRDGQTHTIPASQVVLGDIILPQIEVEALA
jgi:Ca2+-transporting ATPase